MANHDRLITSAEAGVILGVEQATVNKWAAQGQMTIAFKLPGLRGAYLFRPEDVEALRAERAKTAKPATDGAVA